MQLEFEIWLDANFESEQTMDGTRQKARARVLGPAASGGWVMALPDCLPTADLPPASKNDWYAVMLEHKNKTVRALVAAAMVEDLDCHQVLHEATACGRPGFVQLLLDKGVTMNAVNTNGQTAMHIAVLLSDDNTIGVLVDAGIDHKLRDNDRLTAKDIARQIYETREQEILTWA